MSELTLFNLFVDALKFRQAIEKTNKSSLPISFKKFPNGSCGDTVPILGTYLIEKSFGKFDYVLGGRNNRSHAWLQQNELTVDITADQFDDQENKVIVVKNSEWHKLFNGEVKHIASIDFYDSSTQSALLKAYHSILEHIA